nr:MAG TPA: hypothetical protein [Caudoviricetes sp.]
MVKNNLIITAFCIQMQDAVFIYQKKRLPVS